MAEKKKKTKEKQVADPFVPMNVEHNVPAQVYKNAEEFFTQYALKNGVNLKWKKSVLLHLEATGCLKNPKKWLEGIKHFGL